jgi:hypothetical protein
MQDILAITIYPGYKVDMPRIAEKKSEQVLINLTASDFRRLTEIADSEDRPVGYIARELMLRGLSLYELDGKLRGEAQAASPALKLLAPVVARIDRGEINKADVQRMIEAADIAEIEKRVKPRRVKVAVRGKVS